MVEKGKITHRRRINLCTQSKELRASIRRKDNPVCEDAESKGPQPVPVPVPGKFFTVFSYHAVCIRCLNTYFQKVPGFRVFH